MQFSAPTDAMIEALLAAKHIARVPGNNTLFYTPRAYNQALLLKRVATLSEAVQCGGLIMMNHTDLYPSMTVPDATATDMLKEIPVLTDNGGGSTTYSSVVVVGGTMIDHLRLPESRSAYLPVVTFKGDVQSVGGGMSRASMDFDVEYRVTPYSSNTKPHIFFGVVTNMDVGWGVSGIIARGCTNVWDIDAYNEWVGQGRVPWDILQEGAVYRQNPFLPRLNSTTSIASVFVGMKPIPYPRQLHGLVAATLQAQLKGEDAIIVQKMNDAYAGWKTRTPDGPVGINVMIGCGSGYKESVANWKIDTAPLARKDFRALSDPQATIDGMSFSTVSRHWVGELDVKLDPNLGTLYFGCSASRSGPRFRGMWTDGSIYMDTGPYASHPLSNFITQPTNPTPTDTDNKVNANVSLIRIRMTEMGAPTKVKDRSGQIPMLASQWFIAKEWGNNGFPPGVTPASTYFEQARQQFVEHSGFYPLTHGPFTKVTGTNVDLSSWLAKASPGMYYNLATGSVFNEFRSVDGVDIVGTGPAAEVITITPPSGSTGTGSPPAFPLVIERYLAAEMWQGDGVRFATETVRMLQKQVYDSV